MEAAIESNKDTPQMRCMVNHGETLLSYVFVAGRRLSFHCVEDRKLRNPPASSRSATFSSPFERNRLNPRLWSLVLRVQVISTLEDAEIVVRWSLVRMAALLFQYRFPCMLESDYLVSAPRAQG